MRAVPWSGRDGSEEARHPAQRGEPRISAVAPARLYGSQLNRMESTLNSLLEAVASSAGAEGPARPSRPRAGKSHPSLGAAIAEIAGRQRVSGRPRADAAARGTVGAVSGIGRRGRSRLAAGRDLARQPARRHRGARRQARRHAPRTSGAPRRTARLQPRQIADGDRQHVGGAARSRLARFDRRA